jgi:hypothetical protein
VWTFATPTWQTSVLRLSFPEWVPRPPWLSTAVLQQTSHDATYLGGCTTSCRLTSASYLKARGSAAITLTSPNIQGAHYLSWQNTGSLYAQLKSFGGDALALNLVVQADDRLNANFLKHGDQWRLEALQGTCGLPLSVNRAPTNISAGVRTARAWRVKTRWLFQIKVAREVPLQYLWLQKCSAEEVFVVECEGLA